MSRGTPLPSCGPEAEQVIGFGRPESGKGGSARPSAPDWPAVEQLLATLAETRVFFRSATSRSNWISTYEPGKRLRVETDAASRWIQVEHLKGCWDTFERLRRIGRSDVLEPGRCSAFVMALFAHVPGVRVEGTEQQPVLRLDGRDHPRAE